MKTEHEIAREARRVLRRMIRGATLMPDGRGHYMLPARAGRHSRSRVSAEIVDVMRRRGWLAPEAGNLAVTPAGKTWMARRGANPFLEQHQLLRTRLERDEDGRECYVVVNDAESPLAWLRQHGAVTSTEFEAGERLRRDYTLARLTPRLAADLTAPVVSGRRAAVAGTLLPDTVLAAKQRFSRAMTAAGPEFSGLLFDVCCDLRGLEECERLRGWPRGSAKLLVKLALDRLAAHYGARKRWGRTRSWKKEEKTFAEKVEGVGG